MKLKKTLTIYCLIICSIICVCWALSPFFKLGINTTNSIPGTLFLIVKKRIPQKHELVAFYPPPNRFYQHIWFVKYIKGTEGDKISYQGNMLFINGTYLGRAKEKSNKGFPLERTENKTIEPNKIFVWSPHKDSYDSRYKDINTISTNSIIGSAYRIF